MELTQFKIFLILTIGSDFAGGKSTHQRSISINLTEEDRNHITDSFLQGIKHSSHSPFLHNALAIPAIQTTIRTKHLTEEERMEFDKTYSKTEKLSSTDRKSDKTFGFKIVEDWKSILRGDGKSLHRISSFYKKRVKRSPYPITHKSLGLKKINKWKSNQEYDGKSTSGVSNVSEKLKSKVARIAYPSPKTLGLKQEDNWKVTPQSEENSMHKIFTDKRVDSSSTNNRTLGFKQVNDWKSILLNDGKTLHRIFKYPKKLRNILANTSSKHNGGKNQHREIQDSISTSTKRTLRASNWKPVLENNKKGLIRSKRAGVSDTTERTLGFKDINDWIFILHYGGLGLHRISNFAQNIGGELFFNLPTTESTFTSKSKKMDDTKSVPLESKKGLTRFTRSLALTTTERTMGFKQVNDWEDIMQNQSVLHRVNQPQR